ASCFGCSGCASAGAGREETMLYAPPATTTAASAARAYRGARDGRLSSITANDGACETGRTRIGVSICAFSGFIGCSAEVVGPIATAASVGAVQAGSFPGESVR